MSTQPIKRTGLPLQLNMAHALRAQADQAGSPELNPEERLNAELKQAIGSKVPMRTKAKLRAAATEHMTMLENAPERVRKYFGDKHVAYAAS